MHLYYVANVRMPSEKAHGVAIAKMCESLAKAGATVTLVVPRRELSGEKDLFSRYGIDQVFTVKTLPTLDLLRFSQSSVAYWFSTLVFYVSVFFLLLAASKKEALLYTREAPLTCFSFLLPVVLECHHISGNETRYLRFASRAHKCVVISEALKGKFIAGGIPEKKVLLAFSAVDLSTFGLTTPKKEARETLAVAPDAQLVMYVGNFTTMGADKGIHHILQALVSVPNVHFAGVGGSEQDIAHYRQEADELGIGARVQLHGYAPQRTLALWQRAADILLMPFPDSHHYRTNMSPLKMFEYMASGRPIIATDLPTIRVALNNHNAVIVPPDDPKSLAREIQRLLDSEADRERLSSRALEDVRQYSWNERAKRVLAFIF